MLRQHYSHLFGCVLQILETAGPMTSFGYLFSLFLNVTSSNGFGITCLLGIDGSTISARNFDDSPALGFNIKEVAMST